MFNKACLFAFAAVLVLPVVGARADDDARFAAEEAYQPGNVRRLITDIDMAARFVGDDKVLYRKGPHGTGAIMLADPATGATQILAREADLRPKFAAPRSPQPTPVGPMPPPNDVGIMPLDYDATTGHLKLLAVGQAWDYDVATGALAPLPPPPPSRGDSVSPDGKIKVVTRDYNLYAIDMATGREVPLTVGGSYDVRYGSNYPLLGDMAAAKTETPAMQIGVQWSEDSRYILTYQLSRNGAFIWTAVQETPPDSHFPRAFRFVYPSAGAKEVPQIYPIVIDVAAAFKTGKAKVTELDVPSLPLLWPGDPPMWWEGGKVLYQWTKRGYGEVDLYEIDPLSGEGIERVRESIKPVVTVTSSFIRSAPELGGYLNVSERSGWAQLYYLRKGGDPSGGTALTRGAWEVSEILRVARDEPILIVGNGREKGVNPYYRSLYAVSLNGAIRNLTPEPLNHDVHVSENGKWFIDRMSSPTMPTRTMIRQTADGHIAAELGQADASALLATGFTPPEPFQTLADDGKTMLYAMIHRPSRFNPRKKYPVIDYVYTGPTTHVVPEVYDQNVVASVNALAEIGAIVVLIDGRGTSQRGQAFRLPAFQNIGEVGIDDHIHVLRAMQAKYPYFDLSRVGVYGHSAGGYDAARFILRRPNFFKASVASSGIQDPRLDKAWWPEVSMGLADDASWERNSNIPIAGNLKGKLLIVHGDIDDNVPLAASLRLHQALVDANKLHELQIIPNRTHNTFTPYYFHMLYDFFTRTLVEANPGEEPSRK